MAVYDLGLDAEYFYGLTPRQFHHLAKRHEYSMRHAEFMQAQMTAAVINFSMGAPKRAVTTRDLMPSEWAMRPPKKQAKQMSNAQIRAFMNGMTRTK